MYALAFDLEVAQARQHHPCGDPTRAYGDIKAVLTGFGFEWKRKSSPIPVVA